MLPYLFIYLFLNVDKLKLGSTKLYVFLQQIQRKNTTTANAISNPIFTLLPLKRYRSFHKKW